MKIDQASAGGDVLPLQGVRCREHLQRVKGHDQWVAVAVQ